MRSLGIDGEGELREQPANPGSPGKWPIKQSVCMARYLTSNSCLAFGGDCSCLDERITMQLYEFLPLRYMGNTEVYCGQKCQSRIGCMTIRKKNTEMEMFRAEHRNWLPHDNIGKSAPSSAEI